MFKFIKTLIAKRRIPEGLYCHGHLIQVMEKGKPIFKSLNKCPYFIIVKKYSIDVNYCSFMNYWSLFLDTCDTDYKHLLNYLTEEEIDKHIDFCFADECKICGINEDIND